MKKLAVMEFGLPGFGYESIMAPTPDWDNNALLEKNGKLDMPLLAVGGEASSGQYLSMLPGCSEKYNPTRGSQSGALAG